MTQKLTTVDRSNLEAYLSKLFAKHRAKRMSKESGVQAVLAVITAIDKGDLWLARNFIDQEAVSDQDGLGLKGPASSTTTIKGRQGYSHCPSNPISTARK